METANILVVAKDRAIIEKLKNCFSPLGHQVIPAYDVSLGFFLAQKNYPDIILCEPELKEGGAYDLFTEIQSDPELLEIPFVVIDNTEKSDFDQNAALEFGISTVIKLESEEGFIISELLPLINQRISSKGKRQEYSPE